MPATSEIICFTVPFARMDYHHLKNIYLLIAQVENEIRSWNIMNIRVRSLNLIQKLMRKPLKISDQGGKIARSAL